MTNDSSISRLEDLMKKAEALPSNGSLSMFREIKGRAEVILANELGKDSHQLRKLQLTSYTSNSPGKKLKSVLSIALEEVLYVEKSKLKDSPKPKVNVTSVFCYNCNGDTKQRLLFEKGELTGPQEIISYDQQGKRQGSAWTIEARLWKVSECQGCEKINLNVFMRHDPKKADVLVHHFPTKDFRPFPKWVQHLSKDYLELFCEIYLSLNGGSTRLPLMGARTILDMYIVEKIGDAGTFKVKLQKLVDGKYISSSNRDLLEVALEYGHATIHRGFQPTKEQINDVFDIIETILHAEALTDKTKDLKKSMPKKN